MQREDILKEREVKQSRKSKIIWIVVFLILGIYLGYQAADILSEKQTSTQNQTCECSDESYQKIKGITQGIIEADTYSFFFKILMVLGSIYFVFIAIGVFIDIIKLSAFFYVSGKKTKQGIKNIFKKLKKEDKKE